MAKMPTASAKKRFRKLRLPVHVNGSIVFALPYEIRMRGFKKT
jgi:hypothetical protein